MTNLLFITWNVDPNLLHAGGFQVRWYGLLFALGFFFGYIILSRIFKKEGIAQSVLDQLTTYMVVGTVIGARLGHCLFYEPGYYLSHPIEILKIWEGGLASHGAAIGIILTIILFSRVKKLSFLWVMDRLVIVVALAGMLIRLGNLMNSEIFGHVTSLPWGFYFVRATGPGEALVPRHPTQIYEALCYFIIFLVLIGLYYRRDGKFKPGLLFGLFMVLVFGVRFFIEFLKEPQEGFEQFMVLNMGQLLSIPLVIAGIWMIARKKDL
ncbi:MAG: prolipoprotein diacylglyceryl transferase [Syntrophothermus sp.]